MGRRGFGPWDDIWEAIRNDDMFERVVSMVRQIAQQARAERIVELEKLVAELRAEIQRIKLDAEREGRTE